MKDLNRHQLMKYPPYRWSDWIKFIWLLIVDPTFQHSYDKRKAYFEYRLGERYESPFR
jgi:hypothetical protein